MAYQSEAQLEKQFIEQLQEQDYQIVNIPDYGALQMSDISLADKTITISKTVQRICNKQTGTSYI